MRSVIVCLLLMFVCLVQESSAVKMGPPGKRMWNGMKEGFKSLGSGIYHAPGKMLNSIREFRVNRAPKK